MIVFMLVAGIGLILAGAVAIGLGIPVKEFSFGNTLILTGAIAACTGMIMLALWIAVRELKTAASRLGIAAGPGAGFTRDELASGAPASSSGKERPLFSPDQGGPAPRTGAEPVAAPWDEDAAGRDRGEAAAQAASEPAEATAPKRRNLLFTSIRRDGTLSRAGEMSDVGSDASAPAPGEPQPPTFPESWPKGERPRVGEIPPRRPARSSANLAEAPVIPAPNRHPPAPQEQPPVTVLKSGVVDGMAYTLYSDGSIEAQMPEGMMRFASIEELRAHLDQRH